MKSYSPKEVIKILEKNDWHLHNIRGDHYIFKKSGEMYNIVIPISRKDIKLGIINNS